MLPKQSKQRLFWYALLSLMLFWVIAIQAGCLAMRTPDKDWEAALQKKGQYAPPNFHDIAIPGSRTVHAISIAHNDTLPLVVLVHGSPGSADAYLSYLADSTLTSVARLVTVDRPGFGFTSGFGKPEGSLAQQAAALDAVVSRLAAGQKVILVGHSMGGPIIARYAMDYPEKTGGLVIVAGSIDPDQEEHPWWQAAVDAPPLCWLTPKSLWASNREIRLLEAELRDILHLWPNIHCPVTMVHAEDDSLVPFANVDFARRKLVNSIDFQAITMPKGDHFILWSRQEVVRQATMDMIQDYLRN